MKMEAAIPKSTEAASIEDIGNISLGKYIFVRRFEFETRLGMAKDSDVAKKVHGKRAVYANKGYGIPSLGNFPILEKIIVNMSIIKSGWSTDQNIPRTDCL